MKISEYLLLLQSRSGFLQSQLATAEENNRKKQALMQEYYAYNSKLTELEDYARELTITKKMVMLILDNRRDEIIANLERRAESILAVVLPEENFKIKITYTPNRGNFSSEVFVGKEDTNGEVIWTRPKGTNGEFVKQLISFAILASMNILLHSNFLFMDEPFSSADPTNVGKLEPIFNLMLEEGLQLLFIEHKKELYDKFDHNLIQLYKHRGATTEHDGYVEVQNVERISVNDDTNRIIQDTTGVP